MIEYNEATGCDEIILNVLRSLTLVCIIRIVNRFPESKIIYATRITVMD